MLLVYFLKLSDLLPWNWGKLADKVTDFQKWGIGTLRTIVYFLDEVLYKLVISFYDIFRWICGARIVDNEIMTVLATRVGFILGLIMFFYISFDFIQILVDPDKIADKEKGPVNIIKKFIIVIVLLGTSRYIFDLLFNLQGLILNNSDGKGSVIEKLLIPFDVDTDNFGRNISAQFMSQFYQITDETNTDYLGDPADDYDYNFCYDVAAALPVTIAKEGSFSLGYTCLNERYNTDEGKKWFIDFNIISVVVAVIMVYILVMYCISVGMRVIQLALLQIISPAAIICYLSPSKDNVFTKWLKLYVSTYIDVFIRVAIIDFVVLLSGLILDKGMSDSFWTSVPGDVPTGFTRFLIIVIMIMALLSFAKNFPELLKKLLPDSLSSGLSLGFSTKDRMGMAMVGGTVAAGVVGSAGQAINNARNGKNLGEKITGALGGFVFGGATGAVRGLSSGSKAQNLREAISSAGKAQNQINLAKAQRKASGVGFGEHLGDTLRDTFGVMGGGTGTSAALTTSGNVKSLLEAEDPIKHLDEMRQAYINSQGANADGAVLSSFDAARKNLLEQMYSFSYEHSDGDAVLRVNNIVDSQGNVVYEGWDENYSSNLGIHNAISDNEKRSGKQLATYNGTEYEFIEDSNGVNHVKTTTVTDSSGRTHRRATGADRSNEPSWKADNNALKNKAAGYRNKGKQ